MLNMIFFIEWFKEWREDVPNYPKNKQPETQRTHVHEVGVQILVHLDCRLNVRIISEEFNMNNEAVR